MKGVCSNSVAEGLAVKSLFDIGRQAVSKAVVTNAESERADKH